MRLFAPVARWLLKAAGLPGTWNFTQWQAGKPYYPDVSHKALIEKYRGWVYACAHKNAVCCAQTALRLYVAKPARKTKALFPTRKVHPTKLKYLVGSPSVMKYLSRAAEVEEVVEHPLIELLDTANPLWNRFDLLEFMFLSQEITGNGILCKYRNGLQMPTQLWPLMVQYVDIIPSKTKVIERYEYKITSTEKQAIETKDIVHFKYVSLKDPLWGMGPLQAAIVVADLSYNMDEYEAYLMQNRAQPDFAIIMPEEAGEPDEEQKKAVEKSWRKKFGGIKKAGTPAWLYGGAKLQQLSFSPKEINFLAGRKKTLEEIAAIFGVPMSKLTCENINRANAEAGDYDYAKDAIRPRLRKAEQKLNEQLIPDFDDRLFLAFDDPVPEDKEFRLKQTAEHLKSAYSSPNEERQVDGLDEVKWGDVPIVSTMMAPLGSVQPQAPQQPVKVKAVRKPGTGQPPDDIYNRYREAMEKYFAEIKSEALANFDKDADSLKAVTKDRADDFAGAWFQLSRWNKLLAERLGPIVQYTISTSGTRALAAVGSNRTFDLFSTRVLAAMTNHRDGAAGSINNTALKDLRKNLAEGMAEGEGVVGLRKRILEQFEYFEKYHAERIARTESTWGWSRGSVEGYVQSGVVERKQWDAAIDERSCGFCEQLDGQIIGVDLDFFQKGDKFDLNGSSLTFDYEDVGHPPLHCNCRCAIVPVIGEI